MSVNKDYVRIIKVAFKGFIGDTYVIYHIIPYHIYIGIIAGLHA